MIAMMRIPGPVCTLSTAARPADTGTSALTRHAGPAERRAPARETPQRAVFSAAERAILVALDQARIYSPTERAMFLAQIAHETRGFRALRENLRYSPGRLREVFPRRFESLADAQAVADHGADAIAERIYGDRQQLGNVQPGDGARYIGRGYVHLTGRSNYTAAGEALGLDLVNHPELAEQPANAARIAVWFWQRNQIGRPARRGDLRETTRLVNGGYNGLADRQRRFRHYQRLLELRAEPQALPITPQPPATLPQQQPTEPPPLIQLRMS